MSLITSFNKVILRNNEYFIGRRVLISIASNLQANFNLEISAKILHILTNQYQYWLFFKKK
ncbi:MAG: hypothetical protein ACTTNT_00110 [Arsenophonus sp.]